MQLNGKQKPEINYRQMLALCRAQAEPVRRLCREQGQNRHLACDFHYRTKCNCVSVGVFTCVCVCVRVWVIEQGVATLLLKEMQKLDEVEVVDDDGNCY